MSYVVDLAKSPKTLFTELINTENNITLTDEQFSIHTPEVETTKLGFDTKTALEWIGGGDTIGLVNVFYNRIDINTLFSLTGIRLKEVNLTKLDGHVILDDNFYLELQRRYGLNCTSADFEFVLDTDGMYVFRAKPGNLAFKGEYAGDLELSLATRVSDQILDGFVVIDNHDIGLVILSHSIDTYVPDNNLSTLTLASADLVSYSIDCSTFRQLLEMNQTGGFVHHTDLVNRLAEEGVPSFDQPTTAIAYLTENYAGSDVNYDQVIVVDPITSAYMSGKLYLHYNGAIVSTVKPDVGPIGGGEIAQ